MKEASGVKNRRFSGCFDKKRGNLWPEVSIMKHPSLSGYLCLSDMLDQDLSAYEYFQGLPPEVRQALHREDNITSFEELQTRAANLRQSGLMG